MVHIGIYPDSLRCILQYHENMVMKMLTKMIKTKEIYLKIMPFIGLNTLQIEHDDICWVEYITNKA